MGRYVEITKDGNNYTVNPNASPSSGNTYTIHTSPDRSGMYCYVFGEIVVGTNVITNEDVPWTQSSCETITEISTSPYDMFKTSDSNWWYMEPSS